MARQEEKKPSDNLSKWIQSLYQTQISEDELTKLYNEIRYVGFNREETLELLSKFDKKIVIEMIIIVAIRGPQKAVHFKLSDGKTMIEKGIPASGLKSKKGLSANRISASTADLAAFFLKRLNVPKRIESDLPGWLQFATAGSIKLPERYRIMHREFAKKFSEKLGGHFDEGIYEQMISNAYLNESLRLFD